MLLLVCALFLIGAGVLIFMLMRGENTSVSDRLAALEESHGVERQQGVLTRFVSDQQQKVLGAKFIEAGWYDMTSAAFITQSLGGAAIGFVIAFFLVMLFHGGLLLQVLIGFVFCFGGFYYRTGRLEAAIKARKLAIARSLPDFLDMVSSTVEAGIAVNGAIAIAADGMIGPLSEELHLTLQDIRLGRSRSEALMATASRLKETTFTSTVTAIVQAEKLGGDIAGVLEQLAIDARDHRLMRAEELANALPNKLVFPMALFMLPSLFVVIFGAVVANLLQPH